MLLQFFLENAVRGYARAIAEYRGPSTGAHAAMGTHAENIAAIMAENEAIQDSIHSMHFGVPRHALAPNPLRSMHHQRLPPLTLRSQPALYRKRPAP